MGGLTRAPYGVIVTDPPWAYRIGRGSGLDGTADAQYDTLTEDELVALEVEGRPVSALAASDSVMLMWATWPKLPTALAVLEAWGYEYVTGLPWVKIQGEPWVDLWGDLNIKAGYGVGFWFRGVTECLLVGRRGSARAPREANMIGLLCERMQHSRKPENVYHIAETMPGPYLEMFARRPRDGWDAWGNQV